MNIFEDKKLIGSFLTVEILLYLVFMSIDLWDGSYLISSIIKFTTICLCLVVSCLIFYNYERFLDRLFICVALFFTMLADIFLLFTEYYIVGVCFFIVVQIVYCIRIIYITQKLKRIDGRVMLPTNKHSGIYFFMIQVTVRILVSAITISILSMMKIPIDLLIIITVFYIVNFLINIISVIGVVRKKHYFQGRIRVGLFLVGLLLFFLCDLMVGIFNASGYITFSTETSRSLYEFASIGMWMFYLPGQVMISLS